MAKTAKKKNNQEGDTSDPTAVARRQRHPAAGHSSTAAAVAAVAVAVAVGRLI